MEATEPATIHPSSMTPGPTATDAPTRRTTLGLSVTLVVLLAGSALFMSGYSMGRQATSEPGTPASAESAFRPFWDTYHAIRERYAGGQVDRDTVVQGAIRGMIDSLGDPYSSYLTSQEYRDSLQGISGEFEGIGAEIATEDATGGQGCATLGPDCRLVIVSPISGSPAERAGLLPGDALLGADGRSFDGLTLDGARERIRGPKGSTVTLSVVRGSTGPFPLEITRDIILEREVESNIVADGAVGYVRLNGFSDRAATELADALRVHVDAGRTKLVLDLRSNPGGYVTAARAVASQFIGSGTIFWEQDAAGAQSPTEAQPGGVATDPRIAVACLIDRGTASASEIVAGALQDTGRATLVGQRTFGKGTVQQWQELAGEGGAFRLTTARWLTPEKRWIHDIGIEPDVTVEVPTDTRPGMDPILDAALEVLGVGPDAAVGHHLGAAA
jgi:carboxyl-terminal processing protease